MDDVRAFFRYLRICCAMDVKYELENFRSSISCEDASSFCQWTFVVRVQHCLRNKKARARARHVRFVSDIGPTAATNMKLAVETISCISTKKKEGAKKKCLSHFFIDESAGCKSSVRIVGFRQTGSKCGTFTEESLTFIGTIAPDQQVPIPVCVWTCGFSLFTAA